MVKMAQLNRKTKQGLVLIKKESKQSGFVILMGLLVLILGAAVWYGSTGNLTSEKMKLAEQKSYVTELERIKERMLTYAILNPELFDEGASDTSIPGPGYFPCPDIDGDGDSDTGGDCSVSGNLYAMGWIPQRIVGRSFSFLPSGQELENKRYWFAVDARFLVDGQYSYGTLSNRFAPLNIHTPSLVDPAADPSLDPSPCDETTGLAVPATCVPPLTLDGKRDIVMVLFYAGEANPLTQSRTLDIGASNAASKISEYLEQPSMVIPSSSASHTLTGTFISQSSDSGFFNDYAIAITREEWNAAVLSRVAKDEMDAAGNIGSDGVPDLCYLVDPAVKQKNSWFNECAYSGLAPPYPCNNLAVLPAPNATADAVHIKNEGPVWAGWFSDLNRGVNVGFNNIDLNIFSVDWMNFLGLNQLWSRGGGGCRWCSTDPVPDPDPDPVVVPDPVLLGVVNIEGQNWRAVLECPPYAP